MPRGTRRNYLEMALTYEVLIIISFIWLLPLYVAIAAGFKSNVEIYITNILQPPSDPIMDPWVEAWNSISRGFLNSILASMSSTFLPVLIGIMAGYYLSR
jgi:ABC-type glycerol-3-phosphate transport system permease component